MKKIKDKRKKIKDKREKIKVEGREATGDHARRGANHPVTTILSGHPSFEKEGKWVWLDTCSGPLKCQNEKREPRIVILLKAKEEFELNECNELNQKQKKTGAVCYHTGPEL